MSEQKRNVPKLRFPGFTDAWEQRKVSEIMHRATTFSDDPTLPNVEYEDVESGQGLLNKNLLEKAVAKKGLLFEPGDILFGKLRPYLKNWLRPAFSGIAVGDWWVLKPDLATSEFLYAFIQGSSFQNIANMSTGTKMPRSDWNLVANTEFGIPSEQEEQALIGSFFRDLDDLITLHQRKLDHLKLQKRGLLQKMFPRDGSDGPEIRFPGFTDAWEQRKLGEMVNVRSGQDYKHLSEGDIPVYGTGGYMLSVDKALSYSKDAIGIGRKGTIDKPYLLRAPFWTVDTLFYAIPKAENDLDFIHSIFQKIEWRRRDESTGVPSLSKTAVTRIDVFSPSSAEQALIGSFFRDLDDLITLHQRKLDHLKLQKKALLQQMFI
ncbi:MAG: restriction endonuclease subunit S [Eggerthella lenta]